MWLYSRTNVGTNIQELSLLVALELWRFCPLLIQQHQSSIGEDAKLMFPQMLLLFWHFES